MISRLWKRRGVLFEVDLSQGFGKCFVLDLFAEGNGVCTLSRMYTSHRRLFGHVDKTNNRPNKHHRGLIRVCVKGCCQCCLACIRIWMTEHVRTRTISKCVNLWHALGWGGWSLVGCGAVGWGGYIRRCIMYQCDMTTSFPWDTSLRIRQSSSLFAVRAWSVGHPCQSLQRLGSRCCTPIPHTHYHKGHRYRTCCFYVFVFVPLWCCSSVDFGVLVWTNR